MWNSKKSKLTISTYHPFKYKRIVDLWWPNLRPSGLSFLIKYMIIRFNNKILQQLWSNASDKFALISIKDSFYKIILLFVCIVFIQTCIIIIYRNVLINKWWVFVGTFDLESPIYLRIQPYTCTYLLSLNSCQCCILYYELRFCKHRCRVNRWMNPCSCVPVKCIVIKVCILY